MEGLQNGAPDLRPRRRALIKSVLAVTVVGLVDIGVPGAVSAAPLEQEARRALNRLYAAQPKARLLGAKAVGILVFPRIYKAGFMFGAQSGNGVLWDRGRFEGRYNITAASFGLQAGAQAFSLALFFITRSALRYLENSHGWAIGSGPSVVVVDTGVAKTLTSTTVTQDVYAILFGQRGLMAGMGVEGSKITRVGS